MTLRGIFILLTVIGTAQLLMAATGWLTGPFGRTYHALFGAGVLSVCLARIAPSITLQVVASVVAAAFMVSAMVVKFKRFTVR
jgi:hypothetical protein